MRSVDAAVAMFLTFYAAKPGSNLSLPAEVRLDN
jgi:hypothetical protein